MRKAADDCGAERHASVHATAVAISGRALLIFGASKSGKSRLALALIAASTRWRPIRLLGDDRIVLTRKASGLVARPHPRIAGFIERRGLGLVAMPFVTAAPVAAIVAVGPTTLPPMLPPNLPGLVNVDERDVGAMRDTVLAWCATLVYNTCHETDQVQQRPRESFG